MSALKPFRRERGSALVISLVFLLLLTILGLSSMQSSTLQEKMAGNSAEKNRAFQLAEAGLRAGEARVKASPATYATTTAVDYSTKPTVADCPGTVDTWCLVPDLGTGALAYYWIEAIPNSSNVYRITSIGYSRATTNRVVLQSTFRP